MNKWLKENWFMAVIAGAIIIVSLSVGYYYLSLPKINNLKLQDMCSKAATEYFNKNYLKDASGDADTIKSCTYTNHYNNKLMKCFIKINEPTQSFNSHSAEDATFLVDVYENKEVAYAGQITWFNNPEENSNSCNILGIKCKHEDFENLIKPYMEN